MVNFDASGEAAEMAQAQPGIQVGLHFTISSGFCTAPKSKIKALVDEDGRFVFNSDDVPGSIRNLRNKIAKNSHILEQIEFEFYAQVERFRGFGLHLAHIDTHHYINLIHIDIFKKYVNFADELSVSYRGICYPIVEMLHIPTEIIQEMQIIIGHSSSLSPDISLGNLIGSKPLLLPSAHKYQKDMQTRLKILAAEGKHTVELITHPANMTDLVRQHDDYFWARKLETALVNSSTFAQFLKSSNFRLISNLALGSGEA